MVGLLEIYEGYLNKPTCESLDNIGIGRNGKGYRKLRKEDIPIEWLNYTKKHGIKVKYETLIIGNELDPVDINCIPLMNSFYPQSQNSNWCCAPAISQYTNNGSQAPTQVCFSANSEGLIKIPYMGIALIDENGSLDLLMDSASTLSSATPEWSGVGAGNFYVICGAQQNNGATGITFSGIPLKTFNISTAQLLIGTNTLASGGLFSTVIEWTGINQQPMINMPLTINIYLGVS